MADQPEPLRLADGMTRALQQTDAEDDVIHVSRWFVEDSRDELRRLHAVNQELLEALKSTHALLQATLFIVSDAEARAIARQQLDVNRAVIARAEGEKT